MRRRVLFVGGLNLSAGFWSLDGGEVDAVECDDCYAGAPATSWSTRHNEINSPVMASLADGKIPEHLKTL